MKFQVQIFLQTLALLSVNSRPTETDLNESNEIPDTASTGSTVKPEAITATEKHIETTTIHPTMPLRHHNQSAHVQQTTPLNYQSYPQTYPANQMYVQPNNYQQQQWVPASYPVQQISQQSMPAYHLFYPNQQMPQQVAAHQQAPQQVAAQQQLPIYQPMMYPQEIAPQPIPTQYQMPSQPLNVVYSTLPQSTVSTPHPSQYPQMVQTHPSGEYVMKPSIATIYPAQLPINAHFTQHVQPSQQQTQPMQAVLIQPAQQQTPVTTQQSQQLTSQQQAVLYQQQQQALMYQLLQAYPQLFTSAAQQQSGKQTTTKS